MADLDTRDKRFSALNLGLGFGRVLANPDGAWDQGDRQQAMLLYRGIAVAAAASIQPRRFTRVYGSNTAYERIKRGR